MKNKGCHKYLMLLVAFALIVVPLGGMASGAIYARAQSYPEWQSSVAYTGGNRVVYEGNVYEAKWWTKGNNPAVPTNSAHPWQLIGPAEEDGSDGGGGEEGDDPDPVGNYPVWNAGAVYVAGDRVFYDGMIYEAKWWTQGNNPAMPSGAHPWQLIGPGGTTDPGTTPTPSTDPDPTPTPSADPDPDPTPTPSVPPVGSEVLSDAEINELWDGIDPKYSPENAGQRLEQYLSQSDFEALFPRRHGSAMWRELNPQYSGPEYYSYANLKAAIVHVAGIKYKVEYRQGVYYAPRISVLNKATKAQTVISVHQDFNASWNINKPIETKIVDFGCFLADGTENDKKREIAAFLANIAHETSGGWATAPGGMLAWGLYFNEEVSYAGTSQVGYVDSSSQDFPPVPGKSYHGRGPMQLSWNYNYGLISAILYQDKNVLLNNPELVAQDGKLGFMTALLFWMTPQYPKPSCHDVITNLWTPSPQDVGRGITEAGFGVTIVIINGGYEANKDASDSRVGRRIGHYEDIARRNGADITGEKLDTLGMMPFV